MSKTQWQKLKRVFMEAVELEGEQRAAFVEQVCANDEDLRNELNALLRADIEKTQTRTVGAYLNPPGSQAGDSIGPFKLVRSIGQGGMGEVFLAQQEEPVKRRVALKIVNCFSIQHSHRMVLEQQAMARLEHSYVAKLYDAGNTPAGLPFFAMEFVDGLSLIAFADEHQLSVRQRLELIAKVCEGVHHAHLRGIIHRDLKPSNIMVMAESESHTPKIIDFGIAKALDPDGKDAIQRTKTGAMLGTPTYMSPEQVSQADQVDLRTDVYALGVICYELLCGQRPFSFSDQSIFEVMHTILHKDPPSMARRYEALSDEERQAIADTRGISPAQLKRTLKGDLHLIIQKATEKDRNRRYPSALDLSSDIQRLLRGEPITAHPPSRSYLLAKFVMRNRLAVISSALIVFSLLLGGLAAVVGYVRAEKALARADSEATRARAINTFLKDMLVSADPRELGRDVKVVDVLDGAEQALNDAHDMEVAAEVEIRTTLAETYTILGQFDRARAVIDQAVDLARRELGLEHVQTCSAEYAKSVLLYELEQYEECLNGVHSLLERQKRVLGANHEDTMMTTNLLGVLYIGLDQPEEAEPYIRDLYESHVALHGSDNPDALILKSNWASTLINGSNYDAGLRLLEELMQENPGVFGPNDFQTLSTINEYTTSALRRDVNQAIELQRDALQRAREHLGEGVPFTSTIASNLGFFYLVAGQPQLAQPVLEECNRWRLENRGYASQVTMNTESHLVSALIRQERFKQAQSFLDQRFQSGQPDIPARWHYLALGYAAIGELDKAETCLSHIDPGDDAVCDLIASMILWKTDPQLANQSFEDWVAHVDDPYTFADCADDLALSLPPAWRDQLAEMRWEPNSLIP